VLGESRYTRVLTAALRRASNDAGQFRPINLMETYMNSFTLIAIGNLARNPELITTGETPYARFCLVGNDYTGKDEKGSVQQIVTSIWFVAFGTLGETIARTTRKGDQLILEARVRANTWTDKRGETQYDHSFIAQGFRFGSPGGATRAALAAYNTEPAV
jgi:single-stranded DNA-binding protein